VADTIIDSLMNLPLLFWAAHATHDSKLRAAAARSARGVAALLVRPDGSTYQSVHLDRRTGRVLLRDTHQGLSARSTWARGQGWAVYGLTAAAAELRDPRLRAKAELAAGYVRRHLPADGVPRWDYDAKAGAERDTSAGGVTAAGLYRLASLCAGRAAGRCAHPGWWAPLAGRMLAGVLARASTRPPLGFIPDGVGTHGGAAWDDHAELAYALDYTLEAVGRERSWRRRHGTAG
jgi:unsaturated chondroitin disaccharide hydrolase